MTKFILISLLTTAALSAPVSLPNAEVSPFAPSVSVQPEVYHPVEKTSDSLSEHLRGSAAGKDHSNPFEFGPRTLAVIEGKSIQ
jgi:hypothetical protein